MEYSVVIPVYNEQKNLSPLLESLLRVMGAIKKEYEIICVDDGSSDGSFEELVEWKKKCPFLRIIRLERNYGQSTALACGLSRARGNIIITLDSDLQNNPEDIPGLLNKIGPWDVVCGVRTRRSDSWLRIISSRIANSVRSRITGDRITDIGCSLKAYKRKFLKKIILFKGMHRFLPTLLKMEGAKILEVEVSHFPRKHGQTSYGIWNRMFKSFIDLLAVKWMQKRRIEYRIKEEI